MVDGVEGVITAVRDGMIGYIDCVLSVPGNFGYPFGNAFFSFLNSLYGAECSFFKWILKIGV